MAIAAINGDDALYHYFKDAVAAKEPDIELVKGLILNLSIWLPPKVYQRLPILLPFAIRDPKCRKSANRPEEWGSCDKNGYFRDDNTLIKAIPRGFRIAGSNRFYQNKNMANGFVASHIWRKLNNTDELASHNPLTNTFVPNLVWLPRQIAKLTDREGSFAQTYVQALSIEIYKKVELLPQRANFVHNVWLMLQQPKIIEKGVDIQKLNYFKIGDQDVEKLIENVLNKIDLLKEKTPKKKFYCSRYFDTYPALSIEAKAMFLEKMDYYAQLIKG